MADDTAGPPSKHHRQEEKRVRSTFDNMASDARALSAAYGTWQELMRRRQTSKAEAKTIDQHLDRLANHQPEAFCAMRTDQAKTCSRSQRSGARNCGQFCWKHFDAWLTEVIDYVWRAGEEIRTASTTTSLRIHVHSPRVPRDRLLRITIDHTTKWVKAHDLVSVAWGKKTTDEPDWLPQFRDTIKQWMTDVTPKDGPFYVGVVMAHDQGWDLTAFAADKRGAMQRQLAARPDLFLPSHVAVNGVSVYYYTIVTVTPLSVPIDAATIEALKDRWLRYTPEEARAYGRVARNPHRQMARDAWG